MANEPRPKRVRSPSYPSIDLEAAIGRAQAIYAKEKWHEAPIDVILRHWDYSAGSGNGMVQLAALKKFGLLSDEGSGEERKAKLTSLAKDILIYDDEQERLKAVREAAMTPALYQDIMNKYSDGLPSDATLKVYLIKEKGFNDNVVGDLIAVMRRTFEFAKLGDGDIINVVDEDTNREPNKPMTATGPSKHPPTSNVPITVALPGGNFTVVQVPRMPEAAFELFKSLLETYRQTIVASSGEDKNNP